MIFSIKFILYAVNEVHKVDPKKVRFTWLIQRTGFGCGQSREKDWVVAIPEEIIGLWPIQRTGLGCGQSRGKDWVVVNPKERIGL